MSMPLLPWMLLLAPQDPTATAAAAAAPPIEWQRSLDDALAVQQATGLPLLVCVNTDGEVFCDRFANATYLDPAFVQLTRGYVCVVASPDRHTKSDYDGLGRRIECPRFPGCTCSEHIAIEPGLFARFFKGQRYAPRHVAVAAGGAILFDHFLDRDMQSAVDDIAAHKGTPAGGSPAAASDDPAALLNRRDAASRRLVEARYASADAATRRTLLAAAGKATPPALDVLRQGLRDDDPALFGAAATALAQAPTAEGAIDLEDALARCDDPRIEATLLAACAALAGKDPAMAQFVAHRQAALDGLARAAEPPFRAAASAVDAAADQGQRDASALEAELDAAEQAARGAPADPQSRLRVARANLALAEALAASGSNSVPMLLEDGRRAAERAGSATADQRLKVEALSLQAAALWQQGQAEPAGVAATAALDAATASTVAFDGASRWFQRALTVAGRTAAAAARAATERDANAIAADAVRTAAGAFAAAVAHPAASEADARPAADLLVFAGARQQAQELLWRAVRRWPWSRELHDELRRRLVADRGAEALRRRYAAFVREAADAATAEWFAGYAAIVAAELHVGDRRDRLELDAYGECIERMHRSAAANADFADSANHFAVLALAGRALQRHLAGDGTGAVDDLLAAIALRPASMGESDGLGRKPEAILRRIARELEARGQAELAGRLPRG